MDQNDPRYPVLSAVRTYPGLFTGPVAFTLAMGGFAALEAPFLARFSPSDAAVAGGLLGCPALGTGIGFDSSVREGEVRRLFGIGCVLLLFTYAGSATGIRPLFLITASSGFLLQGIYLGRQAQ
jgi:hypothetical protein